VTSKMYKRRKTAQPGNVEHEEVPDDEGILATLPDDSLVPPRAATRILPVLDKSGNRPCPKLGCPFRLSPSPTPTRQTNIVRRPVFNQPPLLPTLSSMSTPFGR